VSNSLVILLVRAAFIFCTCIVSGHAATYHLDSASGNDSADGLTPATAWQSLTKANSVIYQPGDSLLLKSGATWTGRLQPQGSGTLAARIIIDRYGSGPKPLIHGGGIAGGGGGIGGALSLDGGRIGSTAGGGFATQLQPKGELAQPVIDPGQELGGDIRVRPFHAPEQRKVGVPATAADTCEFQGFAHAPEQAQSQHRQRDNAECQRAPHDG
jgi:hypothetical protein